MTIKLREEGDLDVELLDHLVGWTADDVTATPAGRRIRHNQNDWVISDVAESVSEPGAYEWACNTVACVAGHTVIMAGAVPDPKQIRDDNCTYSDKYQIDAVIYEGRRWTISVLAARLIGLNNDEADRLFYADDADGVAAVAHNIKQERGIVQHEHEHELVFV